MKTERVLLRTFQPASVRMFTGPFGSELEGSCPECQGAAKLVKQQTNTVGGVMSHQTLDCEECGYSSGLIAIIKYEVK